MKTFIGALLGLTPSLLAWNYAQAQTTNDVQRVVVVRPDGQPGVQNGELEWISEDGKTIRIIAQAEGDGGDEEIQFQTVQALGEPGDGQATVIVMADAQATGDGRSDAAPKKIKVTARAKTDDADAAQRGWLGVSIMSMPEAVATQMGTQGRGVMINNVMADSPADKAGLENNDVIVAINGEDVAGDVGPAVDLIKTRKPGDVINVGILREGKPMTIQVTLGSRADMKNFEWKFEGLPAEVEERINTRGKFIMRDPSGQVIVKDLGELNDLHNLPDNIRMLVPQAGSRSTQVFVENGKKTIKMNVEKDGSTITIEQTDGGTITVRRNDDGNETVDTYDTEDALKAGDEEAYDLYSSAGTRVFVHSDKDGPAHFFVEGDPSGQWRVHLEQSLAEAKEAYGEAMEELHKHLAELQAQGTFDPQKLHELLDAHGAGGFGKAFTFTTGKPTHRFEVNADGSISVSIRKGDSELTHSFRNENDMANRRPDLYEKYQDVKAADQD